MKDILISIRPQWVGKIANGKKTIEVRKTRPKLETPFKCFIYCIERGVKLVRGPIPETEYCCYISDDFVNGKVVGEFICDRIEDFYCASVPYQKENNLGYGRFVDNGVYKVNGWREGIVFERNDRYIDTMLNNDDLKEMCLSAQELFDYIGVGKHLYAWHISDLKIYDKPRELSEFNRPCVSPTHDCEDCIKGKTPYTWGFDEDKGTIFCTRKIKRPPQSWCYVEE